MLGGKQEVTLARRVGNYCGATPSDGRYVSRSEDTGPKRPIDLINAAKEMPFLIPASELRDRKNKRRQKRNAQRP